MNSDTAFLASRPVFFERNRVFRVYKGGRLFADFFGDEPVDGNFPEEWIASPVRAMNANPSGPREGLSIVKGEDITFNELLEAEPLLMLGDRKKYDVLVKMLDSAVRLPLQAHPDREFSEKHFGSRYGKTEMWLILATRENARVYFGFNQKITREEFAAAIEKSRTDKNTMTHLLNEIDVKPGEVYLVPPKCVHAIGYGCLLLEVQEPTDFTIQPEYWCGDHLLSDYEMYLGVGKTAALDCFDYELYGMEKSLAVSKREPETTYKDDHVLREDLLTYEDTPCFGVRRITVTDGAAELSEGPALYLVIDGEGELSGLESTFTGCEVDAAGLDGDTFCPESAVSGCGEVYSIKKGTYFFLPFAAKGRYRISSRSRIQIAECLPSKM